MGMTCSLKIEKMQREEEKVRKIKDVMKWDFFFFFLVFSDKNEMGIL